MPVERLRERVRGAVLQPGDDDYEDARRVWNARVDRRPAAIVRCTGAADVRGAVAVAREHGCAVAVKGGGHHVSGAALREDGLVLDLGPMGGVVVDPEARVAHVQAGATWGDVDHETQAFGLAVPGTQDPDVGVGGSTLGGGRGWLSRRYGLACDNLRAADVVVADASFVRASEGEHPDLFWALRGGGGGFGVVTRFAFDLHPVEPTVLAGSVVHDVRDAAAVARAYRAFVADAPREVHVLFGLMALPAAAAYPQELHGRRVAMLILCHCGDLDDGERVLAPLRAAGEPLADSVRERSYVAWQRAGRSGTVRRTAVRSNFLEALTDGAIGVVVERGADVPSSGATVFVSHHGGAATDPAPDATAYPHREDRYHVLAEARWDDPGRDDEHAAWVRSFHEAVAPHATGAAAANFLDADEGEARVRAAYGDNHDRLVALQGRFDPGNRFPALGHLAPPG